MKSLLLFTSAMIIYNISYSQISKGTYLLGGNVSFSVTSNGSTTTDYTVIPSFGYLFSNNWEAGLGLGIDGNIDKDGGDESKNFQFDIDPFVSYYHQIKENSKFYCKVTESVGLGFGTQKEFSFFGDSLWNQNNVSNISFNISPGIAWAPLKHFMFAADYGNIGYTMATTKYYVKGVNQPFSTKSTGSDFNINLNPSSLIFAFDYLF